MTPQEEGRLLATVEQIASVLNEARVDVKDLVQCKSKQEERLRHGAEHFAKIDTRLDAHSQEIEKKANSRGIYTVIGLGFSVLLAVITIYKFWGGN